MEMLLLFKDIVLMLLFVLGWLLIKVIVGLWYVVYDWFLLVDKLVLVNSFLFNVVLVLNLGVIMGVIGIIVLEFLLLYESM